MSHVTSPKKSNNNKNNNHKDKKISIRERERRARIEVEEMNLEEPFEFTKKDLWAMIIAGYQIIMPIVLAGAGVMLLSYLLFYLWIKY